LNRFKQPLLRLAKVAAVAAIAAVIGWLSGPDAAAVVGTQYAVIITVLLIPALSAVEKALSGNTAPTPPAPPAA
jgi:hypothetical protein